MFIINEKGILINELVPMRTKEKEFYMLMNIYEKANEKVVDTLNSVKIEYNKMFNYDIINHICSRIKSPDSIVNKMKKKKLDLNYRNLVENLSDIAGVRVVCLFKDDIYKMVKIIEKIPNWNLIEEKDYVKNVKKSGYSGYHMIVEVPVKIDDMKNNMIGDGSGQNGDLYLSNQIFVKVEIQIRTMAMDFWATNEHKIKYKSDKKLSKWDSKKIVFFARVLDFLDKQFEKIYNG